MTVKRPQPDRGPVWGPERLKDERERRKASRRLRRPATRRLRPTCWPTSWGCWRCPARAGGQSDGVGPSHKVVLLMAAGTPANHSRQYL